MAFAALCLVAACPLRADVPAPASVTEKPGEIHRPDWGKVSGWVIDAATRKPIQGARVAVEIGGAFPEKGKAVDLTEADGRFVARAPIGSISSKFDWGRLLQMHPVSLLISPRSITKQTKIVDTTQVNVRVTAEGYRPFVGRVRATSLDPVKFGITLDDVWLAPEKSTLASFSPDRLRLELIEKLRVEPAIAAPGEKVRITLIAHLPLDRGIKYEAFATSSTTRVVEAQVELKREKSPKRSKGEPASAGDDPNRAVFTREVTLPKSSVDRATEISFFLLRDGETVLRQRDTKALLQVAATMDERKVAEQVLAGYQRARSGQTDQALQEYALARKQQPGYALAHRLYGELCMQLNRPAEAAAAFKALVQLDPRDYENARCQEANALLDAGNAAEAEAALAGVEKDLGKNRVPPSVYLCRARIQAAKGNFEAADQALSKAGGSAQIPDETLTEINLKRMDAAVKADPKNPDVRLARARVLDGAGRREEAIGETRLASDLDPTQPWAFVELGDRLRESGRESDAFPYLEHAVQLAPENTTALISLGDAHRAAGRWQQALALYRKVVELQKLNLRARHSYALMLYATGDLPAARRELLEVTSQARDKGDLIEEGLPLPGFAIYFGPKRRLVAGFSVPEAAADMAILEALQDLDRHPDNGLLWQNIGSALLDLDLPALAIPALQRSVKQEPDLIETRFLLGLALRKAGQAGGARSELEAVIRANPLHPSARLELAQLLTDAGESDEAEAQLLAHKKNWPYQRSPRPTKGLGG